MKGIFWKNSANPQEVEKACSSVIIITLILLSLGLVAAASGAAPGHAWQGAGAHGLRIAAGIAALLFFYRCDLQKLRSLSYWIFAFIAVLLVLVLIPGIGYEANHARRWFRLGSLSIQPSEAMKIALVLVLADFATKRQGKLQDLRQGFIPAIGIALFASGLVFLEPDFGTALYLLLVSGAMLVAAGAAVKHFLYAGLFGLPAIIIFAWNKFEHVKGRFQDLASGGGYQVRRAIEVLGSGGFWGNGVGTSMIKLEYVPEGRNDFVAALIGEEWGWIGMMAMLALFCALLFYGLRIIYGAKDRYGALLVFGVLFAIALQAGVNLAVVAGIAPPKGIALPFISSGGSSMVMMCAGIGLVANVARRAFVSQETAQFSGIEIAEGSHGKY